MAEDLQAITEDLVDLNVALGQVNESQLQMGPHITAVHKQLLDELVSRQEALQSITEVQHDMLTMVQDSLSKSADLTAKATALQQRLQQVSEHQQIVQAAIEKEQTYQQRVLGLPCLPLRVGGKKMEVDIATLLMTPEGSYFRGLLRQFGIDGVTDARDQLEEAIKRNGGALPVSEDPETFRTLINYLMYANNPALSRQDPKTTLLPTTEPQRSWLIAAAERLGLDSLFGSWAPASDIVANLSPSDQEMRAVEERYREAFVNNPEAMVAKWQRGELLLDVFSPSVYHTFTYQDGPSYPKLFTHLEHPTAHLPAGARSIVKDLGTFQQHFKHITGGLFEGVDWSNMIVAGGSALACLLRPPEAVEARGPSAPTLFSTRYDTKVDRALLEWLGPDWLEDDDAEGPDDSKASCWGTMHLASSGFGDSDIDVFFYDLSPEQANEKLEELQSQLSANSCDDVLTVRTEHAVTFVVVDVNPRPAAHVQVILRLYKSPAEVLMGFDVDSCCVAYDGSRVYATPRTCRAIDTRQNVVDPGRLSPSYESRLAKYAHRGFKVAVPGFPGRSRINHTINYKPYADLQGLARLVRLEQHSARSCIQMGQTVPYKIPLSKCRKTAPEYVKADPRATTILEAPQGWNGHDMQGVSDYSGALLPKRLDPDDLKEYLRLRAKDERRAGRPSVLVWEDYYHVESVLDASGLLAQYPNMQLAIPVKLQWLIENPGRQGRLTGSFQPIDGQDWTRQAYEVVLDDQ